MVERSVEFDMRDPPVQLHVVVTRNNDRVDSLALPVSRVKDTSVARVVDGRVRQNTRVLLRHTGVGSQPGQASAVVEITRLPR